VTLEIGSGLLHVGEAIKPLVIKLYTIVSIIIRISLEIFFRLMGDKAPADCLMMYCYNGTSQNLPIQTAILNKYDKYNGKAVPMLN
jgi:hypothetical protein